MALQEFSRPSEIDCAAEMSRLTDQTDAGFSACPVRRQTLLDHLHHIQLNIFSLKHQYINFPQFCSSRENTSPPGLILLVVCLSVLWQTILKSPETVKYFCLEPYLSLKDVHSTYTVGLGDVHSKGLWTCPAVLPSLFPRTQAWKEDASFLLHSSSSSSSIVFRTNQKIS